MRTQLIGRITAICLLAMISTLTLGRDTSPAFENRVTFLGVSLGPARMTFTAKGIDAIWVFVRAEKDGTIPSDADAFKYTFGFKASRWSEAAKEAAKRPDKKKTLFRVSGVVGNFDNNTRTTLLTDVSIELPTEAEDNRDGITNKVLEKNNSITPSSQN